MPVIKQYFAEPKRLQPSNTGAEAWTQAARRLGSLGTEKADMQKEAARLQEQSAGELKEDVRNLAGLRQHISAPANLPRVSIRQPAAPKAAREVGRGAASLFSDGTRYPVDPTTGQPFTQAGWELHQHTEQLNEEDQRDANAKASQELRYPIDPTTGAPFTRQSWQNAQWQQTYSQQLYRDQQEAAARQKAATNATNMPVGPDGQRYTQSDLDLMKRQQEVDSFNKRQSAVPPDQPDPALPVDPSTGTNFTQNALKTYKAKVGFQLDQTNVSGTPAEDTAPATATATTSQAPTNWDNIKSAVSSAVSDVTNMLSPSTDTTDPSQLNQNLNPGGVDQNAVPAPASNTDPASAASLNNIQAAAVPDQSGQVVPLPPAMTGGQ